MSEPPNRGVYSGISRTFTKNMISPIFPETEAEFRYPNVVIQNTFLVLWTALGVGMITMALYSLMQRDSSAWIGVIIGLLSTWLGVLTLRSYFNRSREIIVNDDGVAALAFWSKWRSVRWSEIARIERIRRPMVTEWNTWRNGYEFVIRGRQNEEIRFVDKITNLTALLSLLNRYVAQHDIPLVAFDRGSDTRPKIRATTPDRGERKRLLREGYETSLSSLTIE